MKKLAVLVDNELELDFDQIFGAAIASGVQIDHIPLHHTQDPRAVIAAAKGYDYVVAGREPWDFETLVGCADNLKLILRFGAGYDTVDLESATHMGIAVANAPGANAKAVAEHTLALMMAVLRKVTRYDRELRQGGIAASMSQTLEGTVAILGFGNIGQELARLLSVFPVKVIAYDAYPNLARAAQLGVEMVSADEALARADIISLHLPACVEMLDFVRKENLAKMKDGVYIINTSRGAVVNEHDLAEALRSGKVAGAGLDTFKVEPFDQNSELKQISNVVLTPHSAAVSTQGVRGVFESCASTLEQFLKNEKAPAILNPTYWYFRNEQIHDLVQDTAVCQ